MTYKGNDVILAIDVGTGSCRVIGFNIDGKIVARASSPYEAQVSHGRAEVDAERLWSTVASLLRMIAEAVGTRAIRAIGVAAQIGLVGVDEDGRPTLPATTWADLRATEEAREIESAVGREKAYSSIGRRISAEMPVCKVAWLAKHEPEKLANTQRLLSLKDFIVLKLTGTAVTDPVHAAYTGMFDILSGTWSAPTLSVLPSICRSMLPRVFPAMGLAGNVTDEAAEETGVPPGLPVAVGTSDGTSAVLGAGAVLPGDVACVSGTTDVLFAVTEGPVFDKAARVVVNPYVGPNLWLVGGPMSTTGGCVQWFMNNIMCNELSAASPYERLEQIASSVRPGSDGLVFLPSLVGERTPEWNPDVRGVILGIRPHHTRGHIARAVLEGCAFALRNTIRTLAEIGITVDHVRLVGGGARSMLWNQIKADVCEMNVIVPETTEATSLGAVIAAGVAAKVFPSPQEACERIIKVVAVVKPSPDGSRGYRDSYKVFRRLYSDLAGLFSEMARMDERKREPDTPS